MLGFYILTSDFTIKCQSKYIFTTNWHCFREYFGFFQIKIHVCNKMALFQSIFRFFPNLPLLKPWSVEAFEKTEIYSEIHIYHVRWRQVIHIPFLLWAETFRETCAQDMQKFLKFNLAFCSYILNRSSYYL